MPVDNLRGSLPLTITTSGGVKAFLVLFLVFYTVFALILFRQILLMNRKLPTPLSPFLRFMAILYIGVSLAILFMVIGTF